MKHFQTFEGFVNENVNEGAMSNLDVIRQESKSLEDFIKNVNKEYPGMKEYKEFLKDFWESSK